MSLAVDEANTLYSNSIDEGATVVCFLVLQEIKVDPRKAQYLEMDLWSMGSLVQSEFE